MTDVRTSSIQVTATQVEVNAACLQGARFQAYLHSAEACGLLKKLRSSYDGQSTLRRARESLKRRCGSLPAFWDEKPGPGTRLWMPQLLGYALRGGLFRGWPLWNARRQLSAHRSTILGCLVRSSLVVAGSQWCATELSAVLNPWGVGTADM